MALIQLPLRSDLPAFKYQIEIDLTLYTLSFTYNARIGKWFLSIGDQDGNPILQGVKLIVGWSLLRQHKDDRLPKGTLFCLDTSDQNLDPGLTELGSRVLLTYEEPA